MTGTRNGDGRCTLYLCGMHRLVVLLGLLVAMLVAAPAALAGDPSDPVVVVNESGDDAAPAPATPAQETTPEPAPEEEDDPDEEEIGEEVPTPPADEEPEEEEAPPPPPPPAPAPAPVAAPAQLPATGTDERIALAAVSLLLAGLAMRRIARPA